MAILLLYRPSQRTQLPLRPPLHHRQLRLPSQHKLLPQLVPDLPTKARGRLLAHSALATCSVRHLRTTTITLKLGLAAPQVSLQCHYSPGVASIGILRQARQCCCPNEIMGTDFLSQNGPFHKRPFRQHIKICRFTMEAAKGVENKRSFCVNTTLKVQESEVDKVSKLCDDIRNWARKKKKDAELGCEEFDCYVDLHEKNVFHFMEEYSSVLHMNDFRASPEHVKFFEEVRPLLLEPMALAAYGLRDGNVSCMLNPVGTPANEERQLLIGFKQVAAERVEAKAVLLQFLKNLGLSTVLSSRLTKKGSRFVDHLLSILHTRYHRCYVMGREPTTAEIQETLLSYLEALAAEHGEGLVDFLVYFPDLPPVRTINFARTSSLAATSKSCQRRDGTGTSRLTLDGNFKPSVSYALSLGLTLEQIEVLAKKSPSFISCKPERNIQPVMSYFLGLGVTKPGIVKILLKRPQVFVCNLEEYLKPSMLYLESLGIKRSQWPRIIVQFPALFTYGMTKIEATVAFLHAAGLSSADVGFIISRFPHIVSFSVEEKLEPTLEFLKSVGVKDVALFLRRSPQVVGYSVEGNMKPTLRFLIELGYSQLEVTTILNKFPQILGLAINSNIKPKWDYYAQTGWPKSHLVAFPQYFGYSLELRIKPRFGEVLKRGLIWTPNRILTTSNVEFQRLLGIRDHVAVIEYTPP